MQTLRKKKATWWTTNRSPQVIDEESTGESNKSRKRENSKSEHKRLKLDTEEGVSWGEAVVVAEEEKSGFLYNNQ